jgi:simple sugar transport system substrate-binding protein
LTERYRFIYVDGNSNPERQVKALHDLVRQQVDYIVLDPIVEAGWTEALREARDAGIPVIIMDRRVDADPALYTSWVGSDFQDVGRTDEPINIVILEGTPGSSATLGRAAGLAGIISEHPQWHVTANAVANFTQGEGQTVMQ